MIVTSDAGPIADGEVASPAAGRPRRPRPAWLVALSWSWIVLVVAAAALADVLPLASPNIRVGDPGLAPGLRTEWLGTDVIGRSNLSRVIHGARISLSVGVFSVVLGLTVGGILGLLSGYFRRFVDGLFGILIASMLAFPSLLLLTAITAFLRPSLRSLVIALMALTIPSFAQLARANTLQLLQREYVVAARAMGASHVRVIVREVVPNVIFPVSSYAFLMIAVTITIEGSLSFLGLGIPPPDPSWGGMIAAGRADLAARPWIVLVPGAVMTMTVFSFNTIGDSARRRFESGRESRG